MGRYITSVGRYGANTGAFLVPLYGAGEVPQVRPLPPAHALAEAAPGLISISISSRGKGGGGGGGGGGGTAEAELKTRGKKLSFPLTVSAASAQAFCRVAAVGGAVYVLRCSIKGFVLGGDPAAAAAGGEKGEGAEAERDGSPAAPDTATEPQSPPSTAEAAPRAAAVTAVVTAAGQTLRCSALAGNPESLAGLLRAEELQPSGWLSRCIAVTDAPLQVDRPGLRPLLLAPAPLLRHSSDAVHAALPSAPPAAALRPVWLLPRLEAPLPFPLAASSPELFCPPRRSGWGVAGACCHPSRCPWGTQPTPPGLRPSDGELCRCLAPWEVGTLKALRAHPATVRVCSSSLLLPPTPRETLRPHAAGLCCLCLAPGSSYTSGRRRSGRRAAPQRSSSRQWMRSCGCRRNPQSPRLQHQNPLQKQKQKQSLGNSVRRPP